MSLYTITGAQLAFGHVALLDHADFSLEAGERVVLIGRNGAGKSSLLTIVADLARPDDGLVTRQQNLTTVYVPQEPDFDTDASVFDTVASGLAHVQTLLDEFDVVAHKLAETPEAVIVEDRVRRTLKSLFEATGGAVAIVTGREIDAIDAFLAPLKLPVAGVHGFERRNGKQTVSARSAENSAEDKRRTDQTDHQRTECEAARDQRHRDTQRENGEAVYNRSAARQKPKPILPASHRRVVEQRVVRHM